MRATTQRSRAAASCSPVAADGMLNLISGMTDEAADFAYVAVVQATAANGQIGAAMQQGVALAAAATKTGGILVVRAMVSAFRLAGW